MLDLPGIIEGASSGRGRGRQVIAVAKTADLVLMMLDVTKLVFLFCLPLSRKLEVDACAFLRGDTQRRMLEIELEAVGIRLNRTKPDIVFRQKVGFWNILDSRSLLKKIVDRRRYHSQRHWFVVFDLFTLKYSSNDCRA